MKMIAFYNNKGGVGKTSTAINIAYTLSRRQNRILLIDFDGQCNSSRFFTDLTNDESGCERAIISTDEKPLIKKTRYDNIDIVTSSVKMNAISNEFVNLSDEEKQSNIIKFRKSAYDYIIVDMPPAMNDFTENVLTICDYVYVPIELGTFAVQGLARVTQKIANAGTKYACFASKYDKGNKADRELLEIMKKNLGDKVLNTVVPFSRAIKNSISYRITASEYMAWINPAAATSSLLTKLSTLLNSKDYQGGIKMAKKFTFDDAITTDIKGAASNSYIDNIKMIKVTDIETNSENFYSLPDIEELAEDIERQGLIHSLAVTKTSYGTYKLISGHRRLSAIKLLSEKGKWNSGTVPCYVITAKKSEAEMNLDLIMLNHTQRKYSDADIFKEHEELKKIFTQLEADGIEIKGRLREKIAKAMHVSSAQIGKIENIKNNAIDSVKVAVENGELSISTANEIAKHNATKQQEIISSPIEKIKTADVRKTNKDKSKAKTPKCDELNNYSTSDEATEIYLTTDETMFMKKNLDILGFSYLLSVSSDSDKRIIENIISKIKGEKPDGKRC